jgi:competence protein ComEC
VALVACAFAARQPLALAVAMLLLAGGLAARAEAGLVPVRPGSFAGTATLLTDPEQATRGGLQAEVRLDDGRHVEAIARAPAAIVAFRDRAAGERVTMQGRLERSPPGSDWLRQRHIVGQLAVDEVVAWSEGSWPARAANAVRDTLQRGASVLPERQRPLFLGFVLGDTRGQSIDITDDFEGSGLTHLLAVSGENVAFMLILAGPLLRRLALRPRFVATVSVIAFFALMTRFEPSVLRASAMAAIAVTAHTLGREASRLRMLALAVAALLVMDPFLVRSVGFQLSVCASAGIVLLAPPLMRMIPGPQSLADVLAVTIAAQAGVAPILIGVFGGIPLATVPANVLAAPAAAAVMVWGVGAGLPAGLLGDGVASVLHWPTKILVGWIAGVAHWDAALPLGEIGWRHFALVVVGVVLIVASPRVRVVRPAGVALVVIALLAPAVSLRAAQSTSVALAPGATLWRSGGGSVLEIDGRAQISTVLEGLRRSGARQIDVVVFRTTASTAPDVIDSLRRWGSIGEVLAPDGTAIPDATPVTATSELHVGALDVIVSLEAGHVVVDVAREPPV